MVLNFEPNLFKIIWLVEIPIKILSTNILAINVRIFKCNKLNEIGENFHYTQWNLF